MNRDPQPSKRPFSAQQDAEYHAALWDLARHIAILALLTWALIMMLRAGVPNYPMIATTIAFVLKNDSK